MKKKRERKQCNNHNNNENEVEPSTITHIVQFVQSVNTFSSHIVYYLCALCDGHKYLYQKSIIERVRAKCIHCVSYITITFSRIDFFIVAAITCNEIWIWFDSPFIWMNLYWDWNNEQRHFVLLRQRNQSINLAANSEPPLSFRLFFSSPSWTP